MLDVSGMVPGTVFTLQMQYNATEALNLYGPSVSPFLSWLNTGTGQWEAAGTTNLGNVAWAPGDAVGTYGYSGGTVWAVTNHNSEFAATPEPSTFVMLGTGLVTLLLYMRRRRKA